MKCNKNIFIIFCIILSLLFSFMTVSAENDIKTGDYNKDGQVSVADLIFVKKKLATIQTSNVLNDITNKESNNGGNSDSIKDNEEKYSAKTLVALQRYLLGFSNAFDNLESDTPSIEF